MSIDAILTTGEPVTNDEPGRVERSGGLDAALPCDVATIVWNKAPLARLPISDRTTVVVEALTQ